MKEGIVLLILCLAGCVDSDVSEPAASSGPGDRSGLIAWWTFDEGEGTSVRDLSGAGHTATINNGSWGPGKHGSGLEMDGGDDGIVIVPLSDELRATATAITVMAWTYRTAEHNVAVVAHEYPTLFFGFHGSQFKWEIEGEPGWLTRVANRLGISYGAPRASCYADLQYVAVLDKWIHIAATFDGSMARLYADGVEICSRPLAGPIGMPDSPFTMSGYLNYEGRIVDEITGRLDDIRIYNRALSQDDIQAVYGADRE